MKFANICWQNTELGGSKYNAINLGDNLQFMAVDYLYEYMNIKKSDIVYLSISQIPFYKGEKLILPLNWSLFDKHWMIKNKIQISNQITPVFLAMTLGANYKEEYLNEENFNYLKQYEPIGCRDMETRHVLQKNGIQAYLNGCLTSLFPKKEKNNGEQIFFIDAPLELRRFVPEQYFNNAVFMTQQYYFRKDMSVTELETYVKEHYQRIFTEARLVITSRLHVASPCMAVGIPVIVVKKEIDSRFGWIEKYLPVYDQSNYETIDWNPSVIRYEEQKKEILNLNSDKVMGEWRKQEMAYEMDHYYNIPEKPYTNFAKLIGYNLDGLKHFIEKNWEKDCKHEYIIWGATVAAEALVSYIQTEYPNAKLRAVVDKYKEGQFLDVKIIHVDELEKENFDYLFVLSVMASNEAYRLCKKNHVPNEHYYIAGDVFMTDEVEKE